MRRAILDRHHRRFPLVDRDQRFHVSKFKGSLAFFSSARRERAQGVEEQVAAGDDDHVGRDAFRMKLAGGFKRLRHHDPADENLDGIARIESRRIQGVVDQAVPAFEHMICAAVSSPNRFSAGAFRFCSTDLVERRR